MLSFEKSPFKKFQTVACSFMALGMISTAATANPVRLPSPVVVQTTSTNTVNRTPVTPTSSTTATQTRTVIASGTIVAVRYEGAEKILVAKNEKMPITLTVATTLRSRFGTALIPAGTLIKGELKPVGQGVQFVASEITLPFDGKRSLNASSRLITRTETLRKGTSTASIVKGAALGGAAAAAIAALTGDRAIATEEVLGGTGLGAVAGWVFGRRSVEVYSINPNLDLASLTLQSDLPVTVAVASR